MPQYFFCVVTALETIVDVEGTELVSLEEARSEAIMDARSLMSAAILGGKDISTRRIEIRDVDGTVLMVVPFAAAIQPEA